MVSTFYTMYIQLGRGANVSDTLRKRVDDLEQEVSKIRIYVKELQLDQEDLRNKVLRKIQFKKEKEESNESGTKNIILADPNG